MSDSRQPVVTFLVADLGAPTVGLPVRMATLLRGAGYEVQIVGPDLGRGVCPMYRDAFDFTAVPCPHIYRVPDFFRDIGRLADAVRGSVAIAVKAFADTVPVALRLKRRRGARALVYLDEWDGAPVSEMSFREKAGAWLRHAHHPLESIYFPVVERMIPRADGVLSTSTFLQRRFGGELIPMGVDTDFFRPAPPERVAELKRRHGLERVRCIVFGGVVRPHKGIEVVLDALVALGRADVRFVIVGPANEHVGKLQSDRSYRSCLTVLGPQPAARMPEFLSLADLIVLPLKDTRLARSQMPCKIFEAMAMARPIIGTAISDLPRVLDGCGWVVPPDDPVALAGAIAHALDHPDEAAARGRAAREKCVREYGHEPIRRALVRSIAAGEGAAP